SGSLSFEMIRYLSERLPVMICPRWVATRTQPIAIRNVLDYLVRALSVPDTTGKVIEIGGADVVTYGEMLKTYARERGLRRWMVSVPVLTPALSSYWVHWVTPISANIIRPLIAGLRNEVIVRDATAAELFPDIHPLSCREAVALALTRLQAGDIESAWTDALVTSRGNERPVVLQSEQGMIVERRQCDVKASPREVFDILTGMGGSRGWFYANWAWKLRGLADRAVGGVGLRRGRRDPDVIRVGDALDFWRVEAYEPPHLMRLRAEMKVPGLAWLQFEAKPMANQNTHLFQTAFFAPKGLLGLLYWYALYPIHGLIFSGMIGEIAARAEKLSTDREER
ncbi:MAG: SDR family oxidoreductase, partial [bacterium]|nr:SDR family oxidoreductase [bacterium]